MNKLPMDIVKYILQYDKRFVIRKGEILQINRIPNIDEIYSILYSIPEKEYEPFNDVTFVYMHISDTKEYFLTYKDYKIQLQTFEYSDTDIITRIDGSTYDII